MHAPPKCASSERDSMSEIQLQVAGTVRDDVRALAAYPVADAAGMLKLDAMENPYRLVDALTPRDRGELSQRLLAAQTNRYPAPNADALRAKLREVMLIPAHCDILLGNGSDELIDMIAVACARPGAVLLSAWPSFVMYRMSAQLAGLRFVGVDLALDSRSHSFQLDLPGMLAAIEEHQPGIVYLSYPNNPTGALYDDDDIEAIVRAAPGLVVIDEAYHAFAERTWMTRLEAFPNLVVMRTLSKSGLAGVRLGYMAGHPHWLREFDKVRPPYNINVLTQVYAQFALEHHHVLDTQAQLLREQCTLLATSLSQIAGITVYASAANFLLFRVANAGAVFDALQSRKVLVKYLGLAHPLLHDCLRVTVSTPDENQQFVRALRAALGAPAQS
jgi:histidinol-phosphate aminotransferase